MSPRRSPMSWLRKTIHPGREVQRSAQRRWPDPVSCRPVGHGLWPRPVRPRGRRSLENDNSSVISLPPFWCANHTDGRQTGQPPKDCHRARIPVAIAKDFGQPGDVSIESLQIDRAIGQESAGSINHRERTGGAHRPTPGEAFHPGCQRQAMAFTNDPFSIHQPNALATPSWPPGYRLPAFSLLEHPRMSRVSQEKSAPICRIAVRRYPPVIGVSFGRESRSEFRPIPVQPFHAHRLVHFLRVWRQRIVMQIMLHAPPLGSGRWAIKRLHRCSAAANQCS